MGALGCNGVCYTDKSKELEKQKPIWEVPNKEVNWISDSATINKVGAGIRINLIRAREVPSGSESGLQVSV